MSLSGGCQCGAVRYRLDEEPFNAHICHCRMCQKAFGAFFAPLASVKRENFVLTRGELSIFKSSDAVERGFCNQCGTPLSFGYIGSPRIAFAIGSLDEPARVVPRIQYGIEGRLPYFASLAGLPGETTESDTDPALLARIRSSNHQHPDHDTTEWPPKAGPT